MAFPNASVFKPNLHHTNPGRAITSQVTIYIGAIPPNLSDFHFERIIRMCGPLLKWKRAYEKANFGFAEFDDPFIALRAVRILSTVARNSQTANLILKAEDKIRVALRRLEEQIRLDVATSGHRDDITQFLDREALQKVLTELSAWQSRFLANDVNEFDQLLDAVKAGALAVCCHENNDFTSDILLDNTKPPPPPPLPKTLPNQMAGKRKEKNNKKSGQLDLNYEVKIINEEQNLSNEENRLIEEQLSKLNEREGDTKNGVKGDEKGDSKNGVVDDNNEKSPKKPKYVSDKRKRKERRKYEIRVNRKRTAAEIIKKIPFDKRDLFKCFIDWDYVERKKIVTEKMKEWADKKLMEFIGSREEDITDYVVELLINKKSPKKILAKMKEILDEDAEDFVMKLVRRLHFEIISEKQKRFDK